MSTINVAVARLSNAQRMKDMLSTGQNNYVVIRRIQLHNGQWVERDRIYPRGSKPNHENEGQADWLVRLPQYETEH